MTPHEALASGIYRIFNHHWLPGYPFHYYLLHPDNFFTIHSIESSEGDPSIARLPFSHIGPQNNFLPYSGPLNEDQQLSPA